MRSTPKRRVWVVEVVGHSWRPDDGFRNPDELDALLRYSPLFLLAVALGCSDFNRSQNAQMDGAARTTTHDGAGRPWGGLQIRTAGASLENADQIIVLLHGYGASESDLVPLADYLGGESRAFVFPAAPVTVDDGGLAWATTEPELGTAVAKLASLVRFASQTYPNAEISIGGFSQGATVSSMLLADSALPIQHLILYSPALAVEFSAIDPAPKIQVLLAHGKSDDVLPFADSERLYEALVNKGISIKWLPFDSGHTITPELLDATRDQLAKDDG